ncbi:cupin [Cohaesibacter celericrescens]|uniref:Cupin n=1 Tax=Cohaesibacter celericrescens TaxID=2067669 RepID=A0A2N5XKQ7_9HYPH|nr:cupin [Cohaesibacter celericrescens]PLW75111.1 cupin [Cohaesibacter celericrescens]
MNFFKSADFTGQRPWDALPIATIEGASVKLHWSDQPYIWHENDGAEVFVVMAGEVVMKSRVAKASGDWDVREQLMKAGDICHAASGDHHVAHPLGPARMLVIEKVGSV